MANIPPIECGAWIAQQQAEKAADAERCRLEVAEALRSLVRLKRGRLSGQAPDATAMEPYVRRLWNCIEYHWQRFAVEEPIAFDVVVGRLQVGDLGHKSHRTDLIAEIILAQALEFGEPKAAEMFENEYMPKVRAVARHLGGGRALDAVENFAAELVLPREGRPPRIASFQGRTPLASWLRAVVANFWISQTRKRQAVNLTVLPERSVLDGDPAATIDGRPCDELLRPIFAGALEPLHAEDRLLIKMLVLDGVGQNELARSLKVSSGTLTRRRQRATAAVLANIRELVQRHTAARQATNCLELVLAGNDAGLRQRLAEVLAEGVRGSTWGDLPRSSGVEVGGLGSPPHEKSPPHDREVDQHV